MEIINSVFGSQPNSVVPLEKFSEITSKLLELPDQFNSLIAKKIDVANMAKNNVSKVAFM